MPHAKDGKDEKENPLRTSSYSTAAQRFLGEILNDHIASFAAFA
jgi:hypothetical protein